MKKLILSIVIVTSVATLGLATAVTVDYTDGGLYPNGVGNPCNSGTCGAVVSGSQSQVTFTPQPLQQIITENNITVPASITLQSHDSPQATVSGVNFVNPGVTTDASGNVDLSGLQTTQGNTNATNITNLTNTVSNNSQSISTIGGGLTTEITNRQMGDQYLQSQVNNLDNGVLNEQNARIAGDEQLQQNITNETNRAETVENNLQTQENATQGQTQDNTNRIDRLEQTKVLLVPGVRLYDAKKWSLSVDDMYDARHGMNFAVGAHITYKLGKSYEERLLEKQAKQMAQQQAMILQLEKLAGIAPASAPVALAPKHSAVLKTAAKKDADNDEVLLNALADRGEVALKTGVKF